MNRIIVISIRLVLLSKFERLDATEKKWSPSFCIELFFWLSLLTLLMPFTVFRYWIRSPIILRSINVFKFSLATLC